MAKNTQKNNIQNTQKTQKVEVVINGTDAEKAIAKKLLSKKPGAFFRMRTETPVTLAKPYRDQNYSMTKRTDRTVRSGVKYSHISGVVLNEGGSDKKDKYVWVKGAEHYIQRHSENGHYYAVVAPISKGHNTTVDYVLTDPRGNSRIITAEEAKNYTNPSYWNKGGKKPPVQTIHLANIKLIK